MAVIEPQPIIDAAQEWCCIPQEMIWWAVLAAQIDVNEGGTVPDANTLMEEASCLKCAIQPGDLPYLLLGQIASGGGGGSGGGVTCGSGVPVAAPSGSCGLYYDTDTAIIYQWDGAAWV